MLVSGIEKAPRSSTSAGALCSSACAASSASSHACALAANDDQQIRRMDAGVDRQVRVLQLLEVGRRRHDARRLDDAGPLAQRGADLHQRDRVLVEIGEDPKPDVSRHPDAHRTDTEGSHAGMPASRPAT